MKYDFILAVLVSTANEKYIQRLKDFIQIYGFKFTNRYNISFKIVFLAGESEPNFLKDIIAIEYEWYQLKDAPIAQRFLDYIYTQPINYKWIFQVDDDSSTDIDRTYEILTDFYDYQDPICLISGRTGDMCIKQQFILRDMKIRNIFFGKSDLNGHEGTPMFVHSWEATLYSNTAVQKIKLNNRTKEYIGLVDKHKVWWTDNGASVLAKICKVPIVESTFFDSGAGLYEEYSAINPKGRLTHIHYILDSWIHYTDFIKKIKTNKDKIFNTDYVDLDCEIDLWEFSSIDTTTMDRKFHGYMQLNQDGTIGVYDNDNEKYWETSKEDTITLLDKTKKPTSLLFPQNNSTYLGDFLLDKNNKIKHELRKLE